MICSKGKSPLASDAGRRACRGEQRMRIAHFCPGARTRPCCRSKDRDAAVQRELRGRGGRAPQYATMEFWDTLAKREARGHFQILAEFAAFEAGASNAHDGTRGQTSRSLEQALECKPSECPIKNTETMRIPDPRTAETMLTLTRGISNIPCIPTRPRIRAGQGTRKKGRVHACV